MPSSRGFSQPRDQTQVSHMTGGFFTICVTCELIVFKTFRSNSLCKYPKQNNLTWFEERNLKENRKKLTGFWPPNLVSSEKAMATNSSTLAWKIPWTEEPGRLQSMGSLGVGHSWETSLSLFTFMHWRRKWQPTPVFLPGESQGWGSLVGCRLWGRTESYTTEVTSQQQQQPS